MTYSSFSHLGDYNEYRHHETRTRNLAMIDGNLVVNRSQHSAAQSARVFQNGSWGFASSSLPNYCDKLNNQALANAKALQVFGNNKKCLFSTASYQGEHTFQGQKNWTSEQVIEWLHSVHNLIVTKYKNLSSVTIEASDEFHDKYVQNSLGSRVFNNISRAGVYFSLKTEDAEEKPVEVVEKLNTKGGIGDLDLSFGNIEKQLEILHEHLMAKREAVYAKGGLQHIVFAPELAGMLAHEAMGHPCEADLALAGAVTGNLRRQRVASDLITMVDFAHTCQGNELLMPVYADDEGTPAKDVTLIKDGILTGFMHNRETAATLNNEPTGNARAYAPVDEPLIRMRNTAILPGESKYQEMISDVEDGYLLLKTGNGQADTTTEFMFGISLGYEIKHGKIGKAIKNTTVSGTAIKMLQSVDALSDDMHWQNSGYCQKKQLMVVSMGGPAIRAQAQLGGE